MHINKISDTKIEVVDGDYAYTLFSNASLEKMFTGVSLFTDNKRNFIKFFDHNDVEYFDIDGNIIYITSTDDLYNAFKLVVGDKVQLYSLFNYKVLNEGGTVVSLECITDYEY